MPEIQISNEIKSAAKVLKDLGAKEVYLFGSAASGRLRSKTSDIDLAVSGLSPRYFIRALSKAHDVVSRKLDLVDLDDDNAFTRYLKSEGTMVRVE